MRLALRRMPRAGWITLAALLLGVLGYFGFHALFVKVGRSVQGPYSGPARYNPFYVLQRYLEERGITLRTARSWPQPLGPNTLVLWFSHAEVPLDLRSWLAEGGALWTFRDPDARRNPYLWNETPWNADAGPAESAGTNDAGASAEPNLLESDSDAELGDASPSATEPAAEEAAAEDSAGEDEDADFDEVEPEEAATTWCAAGCLQAAQFQYGAGCLTLVRRLGLTNELVSLGQTPARIDALLRCPARPTEVLVVTNLGSPWFGTLLRERAPEALWATALLLVLALWRAGKHFGPRAPARRRERRQMLEHVGAVGMLAARVGLGPLLAAGRNQLRKQLLRRVPHGDSLSGAALVSAITAATEVPEREVERALLDELRGGSQELLAIARAMHALWRKT